MKVRIEPNDWTMMMGVIGLHRIVQFAKTNRIMKSEDTKRIQVEQDALVLDPDALSSFAQAYFDYMIDQYSVAKREEERLKKILQGLSKSNVTKDDFRTGLKNIRDTMKNGTGKIVKYYEDTTWGDEAKSILEDLKEIKQAEQLEELHQLTDQYLKVLAEPLINRKLTVNYFKTAVMQPFFGQVSFLQAKVNSMSYEEHINLFHEDYIRPVLLEAKMRTVVDQASSADEVLAFLDEYQDYSTFGKFKRKVKKRSLEEIRSFFKQEMSHCTLIEGQLATLNFEEMVFSPLGVSQNNALNFNWNLTPDETIPISRLARLILFCAPAGAAVYLRKDGFGEQSEYRTYMGFVQSDSPLPDIIRKNNHFQNAKRRKEPFDRIVSWMIEDVKQEAGFVADHLLFIEFSSEYRAKKTLLDYYHLPRYLAEYLSHHADKLDHIRPWEYREQFIRHVLKGEDPRHMISRLLRQNVEGGYSGWSAYVATRERYRMRQYAKHLGEGGSAMDAKEKRVRGVYRVYRSGADIREKFNRRDSEATPEGQYTASGTKKISGIAYRLLNAANANNRKSFMDTVMRLHMSVDKPVPTFFLDALHERELDFHTVANAFVAGLLSEKYEVEKEESKGEGVTVDE